jgi:hypothetical protein
VPEQGGSKHSPLVFGCFVSPNHVNVAHITSFRHGCCGVLVESPEVRSKLPLSFNVQVLLVTGKDDSSGGNQSCEVVLGSIG